MKNKKGFILLLTLIFMTVLTVFAGSLIYMTTADMRNVAPQSDDVNLCGMADAGIDKAHRAIRDDYLTTTSIGAADLRGGDTGLSNDIGNENERLDMCYNRNNNGDNDSGYVTINNNNDNAILRTFDSNYVNTRIISVEICVDAVRQGGNGSNNIVVGYTTDGNTYTAIIDEAIPVNRITRSIPVTGLTWSIIMSPNFRLRAQRTGAGSRNIRLYSMYLKVTYGIDTLAEDRATGGYAVFPVSLSGGTIESITITDEAGKVHLNYASQALLQNLLTNLSISNASTKATAIVNYRGAALANPFESVEELQQVTGITASDYAAIKYYVTVYSFVNSDVYRPAGSRAPVNINTAPYEVLKAIFDPINLSASDPAGIANSIITFRNSTPFTCFYSSDAAVTTDFYDFIGDLGYLSNVQENRVRDNCDPSSLVPVSGYVGQNCLTTEFCYASNVFSIDVLAHYNGRSLRVKTLRGNDGSRAFTTYAGDTTLSGWRKENYE